MDPVSSCVAKPLDAPAAKAFRLAMAAFALALGCSLSRPTLAQALVLDRTIELPDVRGRPITSTSTSRVPPVARARGRVAEVIDPAQPGACPHSASASRRASPIWRGRTDSWSRVAAMAASTPT
jgi:hypothetical protein